MEESVSAAQVRAHLEAWDDYVVRVLMSMKAMQFYSTLSAKESKRMQEAIVFRKYGMRCFSIESESESSVSDDDYSSSGEESNTPGR